MLCIKSLKTKMRLCHSDPNIDFFDANTRGIRRPLKMYEHISLPATMRHPTLTDSHQRLTQFVSLGFKLNSLQRPSVWIQFFFSYIISSLLLHQKSLDLLMFRILSRTVLTWNVKPGHPGDLQNNLSNLSSRTHARIIPYELLRRSTLTLKDF